MPAVNAWAALQSLHGEGTGIGLLVGFLVCVPLLVFVLVRDQREDRKRDH